MVEFKFREPTVSEKRDLRKELEKINLQELMAGKNIIPTDFAEKALRYCFGISEEKFYDLNEGKITELVTEAMFRVFFKLEKQKKS